MSELNLKNVPEGSELVITTPQTLSYETARRLREEVQNMLPGRKVLLLSDGLQIHAIDNQAMLVRIESKLDALLAALAEDEEPEADAFDLDGNLLAGERDQSQAL